MSDTEQHSELPPITDEVPEEEQGDVGPEHAYLVDEHGRVVDDADA